MMTNPPSPGPEHVDRVLVWMLLDDPKVCSHVMSPVRIIYKLIILILFHVFFVVFFFTENSW